ncbi:MAG: PhoU domain-containing protein [Thermoplasmata archaeon]
MEYRKLQKTGGATYILSLPKSWIKKNNLREGDMLAIDITAGGELQIHTKIDVKEEIRETSLFIGKEQNENHVIRKLIALYLAGYNIVKVVTENVITEKTRKAIEKFCALVIGVEIIEEKSNMIVLQDLSNTIELPMDKMLNRMYIMSENMVNDSKTCFEHYDESFAREIIERDVQVDRIYWLICKQYNMSLRSPSFAEKMGINLITALNKRSVAKSIERISDHAENIVSIINTIQYFDIKEEQRKEITSLFDRTIDILRKSYRSYILKDGNMANEVIENAETYSFEAQNNINVYEEKQTKNFVALSFIIESLIRICMYSADICETTINEDIVV